MTPSKPRKFRRPALDAAKKGQVVGILAVGGSRRTAAKYVGCSHTTIQRTALRDPEFAKQLEHAESIGEVAYLKNIRTAAEKAQYWRAAAWVLERRHPQEWGPRSPHVLTREEMQQLLTALAYIVTEEVPVAVFRKSILNRLMPLILRLGCPAPSKAEDHEPEPNSQQNQPG